MGGAVSAGGVSGGGGGPGAELGPSWRSGMEIGCEDDEVDGRGNDGGELGAGGGRDLEDLALMAPEAVRAATIKTEIARATKRAKVRTKGVPRESTFIID